MRESAARTTAATFLACAALAAAAGGCGSSARGGAGARAGGRPSAARLTLAPCALPDFSGEARCGELQVSENRAAPGGRTITLKVAVLPPTGPRAEGDPIVFLPGGPGLAATEQAAQAAARLVALRARREIVLVDMRGTSGPADLSCDLHPVAMGAQRFLDDPLPPARARECLTTLRARADLSWYTTRAAAEDLDQALDALGYGRVNLYGGAYGSRLALAFLRRYPERVRSVVLRSVVPPQYVVPLPYAQGAQRALDRLIADCAVEPTCRDNYTHLRLDVEAVLARLKSVPAIVEVRDPETGRAERARLTRDVFAERLRQMLAVPELASRVPLLVHRAAQNDFGPFANAAVLLGAALDARFRAGLYLAVTCNEDIPRISAAAPDSAAGESFVGAARARQHVAACDGWPRSVPAWQDLEPVQSTVPSLVISGGNDPVTPPQWGGLAVRSLSQGVHLIVPAASHADTSPCADGIVTAFVESASIQHLDISCAERVRRPPFVLPGDAQR